MVKYKAHKIDDLGRAHSDNGPAIITEDGRQYWYRHGYRHRLDGPAVVYGDGSFYAYWILGCEYNEDDFNKKLKSFNCPEYFQL